jgi:hypothetical protein
LPEPTKNGVSFRDIFRFSRKSYIEFDSYNEAFSYMESIKRECNANMKRWEVVHWYVEEGINNIVNQLSIYQHTTL